MALYGSLKPVRHFFWSEACISPAHGFHEVGERARQHESRAFWRAHAYSNRTGGEKCRLTTAFNEVFTETRDMKHECFGRRVITKCTDFADRL